MTEDIEKWFELRVVCLYFRLISLLAVAQVVKHWNTILKSWVQIPLGAYFVRLFSLKINLSIFLDPYFRDTVLEISCEKMFEFGQNLFQLKPKTPPSSLTTSSQPMAATTSARTSLTRTSICGKWTDASNLFATSATLRTRMTVAAPTPRRQWRR